MSRNIQNRFARNGRCDVYLMSPCDRDCVLCYPEEDNVLPEYIYCTENVHDFCTSNCDCLNPWPRDNESEYEIDDEIIDEIVNEVEYERDDRDNAGEEDRDYMYYPVVVHDDGVIICESCGPIGRTDYVPTYYVEGYTEDDVWTLDQDGSRIEFQYDNYKPDELPGWRPVAPLSFVENRVGLCCKKCGAEPHMREHESALDADTQEEEPVDRAEYIANTVDVTPRIVRKNKKRWSKSEPNTPTVTFDLPVRSYSDEMVMNPRDNIAQKFLLNYSIDYFYPAEDDEKLITRTKASKKSRSKDIYRERGYKNAGLVDKYSK